MRLLLILVLNCRLPARVARQQNAFICSAIVCDGASAALLRPLSPARYTCVESEDAQRNPVAGEKRASQEEVDGIPEAKRTRVELPRAAPAPVSKENVAPNHVQLLATLQKTNKVSCT